MTAAVQRVRFSERAAELGLDREEASLLAPAALRERRLQPADPDQEAREAIAMVAFIVLLLMVL